MSDPVDQEIARKTRRAFLVGGAAAVVGGGAWAALKWSPMDQGVQTPLRVAHRANEKLSETFFSPARMARTFDAAALQEPRVNGRVGLEGEEEWSLTLVDAGGHSIPLKLEDIQSLPKAEMITELKCIEGWSRIIKWGGARFADFAAKYAPQQTDPNDYVALETPDKLYYVGLDMPSAMHPQTLLCYEMNGAELEWEHGYPLRLVMPIKYGIKNLKRIGRIQFTKTRPRDYWAERGYDWYSGF